MLLRETLCNERSVAGFRIPDGNTVRGAAGAVFACGPDPSTRGFRQSAEDRAKVNAIWRVSNPLLLDAIPRRWQRSDPRGVGNKRRAREYRFPWTDLTVRCWFDCHGSLVRTRAP